jgi:hypothetical protein
VIDAYKAFGIEPTKLSSPVAVYGDVLERVDFPRACDLPNTAFDLLDQSAKIMTREWREVYKIGHWNKGEIFDYDISSAYPSLIANLPDIRVANYFSSNTMPDKYSWGLLKGKLNITAKVSPFTEDTDLITTEQLWLLNRWRLGTFELEQGWFFQMFGKHSYPLRETIVNLYLTRQSPNILVSLIAKAISVGIYGRLAQRYDDGKLGSDFNSIYALMTTSRCAVKVCDFIYRNAMENDVISVMVDGCLTTKKIEGLDGNGLGNWRLNELTPALVLSVLYQWLGDKKPNGLTYDEMINLIKKQPNSSCYGNVDLNLIEHDGNSPKTGKELLEYKTNPLSLVSS